MPSRNIVATLLLGSVATLGWADPGTSPGSVIARHTASPELIKFVRSVVATNPRVQAAQAALAASKAFRSAAARPLYNPEIELGAENTDVQTRTLGISQTIDWGGKRSARTAVADAEFQGVEADYLLTRRLVTSELLSGLASYQTAVERHALAIERVRLMQDFASLAKQRFKTGDMPQIESNLATLVFADARMVRATAAADLADARQQVNNLTLPSNSVQWPTLDAQLLTLPPTDPQPLLMTLPEVQASQRRVESANAVVALRKREKRSDPTISLTGGEENGESLVGLNLSIPIPIRNSFRHEVAAAYEQYQQAQNVADDVLRRAHARLMSASERYQISLSAWQDWQAFGLSSLQQQETQLQHLWETGELSMTDFLVQTSQTLDSQDSALELRLTLWRAWIEWLDASGQVDKWLGIDSGLDTDRNSQRNTLKEIDDENA